MSAAWKPQHAIRLIAGTPPGGGLDRVARALEKAFAESGSLGVPLEVINIAGAGARKAWTDDVDRHVGDGHVVAVSSPNLTTDYLVGALDFEHTKYTPIATLITEYIAFAARADSPLKTGADFIARLRPGAKPPTVALSTALGNPNHIALAKLSRHAGGDINAPVIRVFDSAPTAVADVVSGTADVCAVTAASVITELKAGNIRVLGISAPERLNGTFADTPTWREQDADCVIGAWRGITGPPGLDPTQVAFWEKALREAIAQPVWREELARLSWSPFYKDGAALSSFFAKERAEFVVTLGELGLLER
ncbi:MAG TPA: tripartite tricarboxylate transporter substrate binding protein [Xanthobacteraceae bacterium]|jgi:putative tricarboxylic transport membrane protein|nr:tripartite tricarboxylate transporter substrate binding protein [Xanthobacteraceae bacterium]